MRRIVVGVFAASLCLASQAFAADMPVKAPPPPPAAPAPSWTGFYVGGEVGGAWSDPHLSYSPNDGPAAVLVYGQFGLAGEQPFAANSFKMSGVTGGLEGGYNWQINPNWLVGIETDFNGSSLKGTGSSTTLIQTGPVFNQTINVNQTFDWYGTLRGRLGFLPSNNLLLFGTGGLAYGRVIESGLFTANGPTLAGYGATFPPFSWECGTNGSTCFAGTSSQIRVGYTLGGGLEWLFWQKWSVKAEYQYVNLGSAPLRFTAIGLAGAGTIHSSFNANFARDDFQVVRGGVNYHF
jgi:outer membrane immunogenic protein